MNGWTATTFPCSRCGEETALNQTHTCPMRAWEYGFDLHATATRLADALLEIVGRPWGVHTCRMDWCNYQGAAVCPYCESFGVEHGTNCVWPIVARALGIA